MTKDSITSILLLDFERVPTLNSYRVALSSFRARKEFANAGQRGAVGGCAHPPKKNRKRSAGLMRTSHYHRTIAHRFRTNAGRLAVLGTISICLTNTITNKANSGQALCFGAISKVRPRSANRPSGHNYLPGGCHDLFDRTQLCEAPDLRHQVRSILWQSETALRYRPDHHLRSA